MGYSDCDVAPGKFMTLVFFNIFAGLGISPEGWHWDQQVPWLLL